MRQLICFFGNKDASGVSGSWNVWYTYENFSRFILINFMIIFFISGLSAQSGEISFATANQLYESKNYNQAIEMYGALIKQQGPSATIYYNLANACYKNGQTAKAILNYERCLRLDPGDDDATFNLQLAYMRIKDKLQPVDELFLITWWRNTINMLTAKVWSFISILFIWLVVIAFAVYRLSKNIHIRKTGFYTALIFLFFFILSFIIVLSKNSYDANYQFAIVTAPSATVKSEPSEGGTNLFLIHEGLKLRVLKTDGEWTEIKMPDGNVGWLVTSAAEKI